ncbi:unnamed protein product [Oncorhynchus mykiss]|uniref:Uncharacterized protein n=1 Tax=Oncorhynchus mykiss TaxID=8022 RepID=A0A060XBN6_ONCMY|nr:unnamed protein product [Oncorhynchus mykiss]
MKTFLTIEIKDGRTTTTSSSSRGNLAPRISTNPIGQRAELTLGLRATPFKMSSSSLTYGSSFKTRVMSLTETDPLLLACLATVSMAGSLFLEAAPLSIKSQENNTLQGHTVNKPPCNSLVMMTASGLLPKHWAPYGSLALSSKRSPKHCWTWTTLQSIRNSLPLLVIMGYVAQSLRFTVLLVRY